MTLKKKLLVATAAGALTAAAAVPAMALENEFHGMYKLKYFLSNYESGGSGTIVIPNSGAAAATNTAAGNTGPFKSATAANYFEQRARIFYTAKANDDLKLVTAFEIDSVFGDKAQGGLPSGANTGTGNFSSSTTAFRNSGGALESDAVNLETKWVYLDFNIPSTPVNMRTGIMPIKDTFKGVFIDADIAGILANAKFGALGTTAGYFRAYENTTGTAIVPRGTDNQDIATLAASYAINKDLTVGGQYFYFDDNRTSTRVQVHVIGLTGEAKFGPATISGFGAYQAGFVKNPQKTVSAFAANVAGKYKVGPGTAKATFLYTSGDEDTTDGVVHSWQSIQTRTSGPTGTGTAANSFNESGMMLLNRNTAAGGTSTDQSILYNTNNNDRGVIIAALGYDAVITPKAYTNVNLGFGFNAENKVGGVDRNSSQFVGTEINGEVGYKLFDNLTASVQAAYVFLGPYTKKIATGNNDPVDPYTARAVLSYTF